MSAFVVHATWSGGLKGQGRLWGEGIDSGHAAPASLGGSGEGTNPEELVLGAAASCYLITLGAILERRGLAVERVELSSELQVSAPPALRLLGVVHRPRLFLARSEDAAAARDAALTAEKACLIARAMSGNVPFQVEVEIRAC